jgi:hypothetical protein
MCDYQGYEFGAGSYPDSVCIDGRLYDADNCDGDGNLFDTGEDIPCPMCNPKGAVEYWTDQNRNGGGTRKAAAKAARSLVADIRANRGVTT